MVGGARWRWVKSSHFDVQNARTEVVSWKIKYYVLEYF